MQTFLFLKIVLSTFLLVRNTEMCESKRISINLDGEISFLLFSI